MEQPPGFVPQGEIGKTCHLRKSHRVGLPTVDARENGVWAKMD